MKLYSRQTGEVTHVVNFPAAKVAEYEGEVFISSWSRSENTVTIRKYDLTSNQSEIVFTFPHKSNNSSYCSVSANYIVALENDHNRIILYNRKSRSRVTTQVPGLKVLFNLMFQRDGTLLVTGHDNVEHKANMYRVREAEVPVLIWSCDQVPRASGIAADERGNIYVSGQNIKTIYMLSYDGETNSTVLFGSLCYFIYTYTN